MSCQRAAPAKIRRGTDEIRTHHESAQIAVQRCTALNGYMHRNQQEERMEKRMQGRMRTNEIEEHDRGQNGSCRGGRVVRLALGIGCVGLGPARGNAATVTTCAQLSTSSSSGLRRHYK